MRCVEESFIGFAIVVLLAAGPLGLSACSSPVSGVEPSANGASAMSTGDSTAVAGAAGSSSSGDVAVRSYNAADVEFATAMVAHHAQAIEMVQLVLRRTRHAKARAFAKRIEAAQTPEIVKLYGWLQGWDQQTPSTAMPMASETPMERMMTAADIEKLKSASKSEVEIIFLTQMSEHHEGAVGLAEAELASGINPQAKTFAQSIKKSQTAEISKLNALKASIS
jgi:uncharacterized protein (DUF305 family)